MTAALAGRTFARRAGAPRLACITHDAARGFTLVELVLVMLVISMVLALSAPSLRGFLASRQTADSAQTVLALTQWARSYAVSQGQPCRLNVDSQSGAYWLTVQDAGKFVAVTNDFGRRFQIPTDGAISLKTDSPGAKVDYVQFYPTGRNDVATIEIRGKQGETYQVACLSATESFRVISPAEAH